MLFWLRGKNPYYLLAWRLHRSQNLSGWDEEKYLCSWQKSKPSHFTDCTVVNDHCIGGWMKHYKQDVLGYRVILFSCTCALMAVNMWDVDFVSFRLILHSTDIGLLHLVKIISLSVNDPVCAQFTLAQSSITCITTVRYAAIKQKAKYKFCASAMFLCYILQKLPIQILHTVYMYFTTQNLMNLLLVVILCC
jgi:hypothetical protein